MCTCHNSHRPKRDIGQHSPNDDLEEEGSRCSDASTNLGDRGTTLESRWRTLTPDQSLGSLQDENRNLRGIRDDLIIRLAVVARTTSKLSTVHCGVGLPSGISQKLPCFPDLNCNVHSPSFYTELNPTASAFWLQKNNTAGALQGFAKKGTRFLFSYRIHVSMLEHTNQRRRDMDHFQRRLRCARTCRCQLVMATAVPRKAAWQNTPRI